MRLAKASNVTQMKKLLWCILCVGIFSCEQTSKLEKEIAAIPIDLEVIRFDRAFARTSPDSLAELKAKFPQFFPEQFADSVWLQRMTDTLQRELLDEVALAFPEEGLMQETLEDLFRHYLYYFPGETTPKVYTLTTDVDYRNRIVFADSVLLIGLDNYLGEDHRFYEGIQQFVKSDFRKEQIPVHVGRELARSHIGGIRDRSFLSQILYYGKMHAAVSRLYPEASPAAVLDYTPEQYDWALANEDEIWRYFVERELLFSNDRKLADRFLDPAPFSKFYLELDNESPPRLGQFLGWRIAESYMRNNDVSLQALLAMSGQELFEQSNYKPEK